MLDRRAVACLVIVLSVAMPASAELLIGRGRARSECYVAVDVASDHPQRPLRSVDPKRGRVVFDACGDRCDVDLTVCTNVTRPGCKARPIRDVLSYGHVEQILNRPPEDGDTPRVDNCSTRPNVLHLGAGEKRRLGFSARARGRPRRDDDWLTLECRADSPAAACCGNGRLEDDEECDDGNRAPGDDCDPNCRKPGCPNGYVDAPLEECDDDNLVDGDGCDHDCSESRCGNGIQDPTEECECGNGIEDPTEECNTDICRPDQTCYRCACVPKLPCTCRAPGGSLVPDDGSLELVWAQPPPRSPCGAVTDAAGASLLPLDCGQLYFGGGPVNINEPTELGGGTLRMRSLCSGGELRLSPATSGVGCTAADCLFGGRPVCFPGQLGPTALVISVGGGASGTVDCATWSAAELDLPLEVEIFVNPNPVSTADDPEGCGVVCAGPRRADCSTAGLDSLGVIRLPSFSLRAPTVSKVGKTIGALAGVFCGYCRQPGHCFQGDPNPSCGGAADGVVTECSAISSTCITEPFTSCHQSSGGAFGEGLAQRIEVSASLGGNLGDLVPHDATLASIACIPPTFQRTCPEPPCPPNYQVDLDFLGSFPGPAALSLQGQLRLVPAPPAADP